MTNGIVPAARTFAKRRLVLLGSVAAIGAAVILGGPGGTVALNGTPARAVETTQARAGFADLIERVKPAVVSVRVKIDPAGQAAGNDMPSLGRNNPMERFFRQFGMPDTPGAPQGRPMMPQGRQMISGQGSGFFISPDGYAVTNFHVVDHATTVQVQTDDGKSYTAKVVGTDQKTDLALIKVDSEKAFPFVAFADNPPRVGDWVVAVGNPFGLAGSATAGIVSARGRDIGANPYDDFIQIDAPINKGNSGGPAFDIDGKVIAVNTAIFSPSGGGSIGIGFGIPADTVKTVVAQLRDKGRVERGWIGVKAQPVSDEIADSLGLKKTEGALVAEAQADAPAAKAGIVSGDVITAVNGNAVKDSRDLAKKVSTLAPGSSIKLAVLRKGEEKSVTVTLGKLPDERQAKAAPAAREDSGSEVPRLGLTIAPAGDVAGAGSQGVVVTSVDPDGAAAEHGVQNGDVILEIAGKPVASVTDVKKALTDARDQGRRSVLMRLKSGEGTRFVAVPFGRA
jgi:serine protease Do